MHIQPHAENRRAFAKWAIRHRVRTSSSNTFGVPDQLFEEIPESILLGALIDGQLYEPSASYEEPVTDAELAAIREAKAQADADAEAKARAEVEAQTEAEHIPEVTVEEQPGSVESGELVGTFTDEQVPGELPTQDSEPITGTETETEIETAEPEQDSGTAVPF